MEAVSILFFCTSMSYIGISNSFYTVNFYTFIFYTFSFYTVTFYTVIFYTGQFLYRSIFIQVSFYTVHFLYRSLFIQVIFYTVQFFFLSFQHLSSTYGNPFYTWVSSIFHLPLEILFILRFQAFFTHLRHFLLAYLMQQTNVYFRFKKCYSSIFNLFEYAWTNILLT